MSNLGGSGFAATAVTAVAESNSATDSFILRSFRAAELSP
jgi:hypothetical protein